MNVKKNCFNLFIFDAITIILWESYFGMYVIDAVELNALNSHGVGMRCMSTVY